MLCFFSKKRWCLAKKARDGNSMVSCQSSEVSLGEGLHSGNLT